VDKRRNFKVYEGFGGFSKFPKVDGCYVKNLAKPFYHSRVIEKDILRNTHKLIITIDYEIFTSSLWESKYSEYQEFLYQLIRGLYRISVTGKMGYRKISHYLNSLGIVTPNGNKFSNTHVFSILKKGGLRVERMNKLDGRYRISFEELGGKKLP